MSEDKKNNLIIFPTQKKSKDQNKKPDEKKTDNDIVHLSSTEPELKKTENNSSADAGENSKKNVYTTASVTSALCLMLVGFPFFSNINNETKRGLDCASEDLECIERENRERKRLTREENRIRKRDKRALRLIQSGRRKLASIGRRPGIKDIFSIEHLKSSYQVRWNRNRLVYAVLLDDRSPVFLPPIEQLVREYSSIFPKYASIRKIDSLSGDMEIYELKDAEGLNVAQVEALRDRAGRLISIHVQ